MTLDALNRRSRWSHVGGRRYAIHDLSREDIELLKCLDPRHHKILPASYLAALTRRSKPKVQARLAELSRVPNYYVRVIPEVKEERNNTTQFHYEIWRPGMK